MDETRESEGQKEDGNATNSGPAASHPLIGAVSLGDLYERGSHLYATRTSEAYEAVDARSRERVMLWTLRFPLSLDSSSALDFVKRLETISKLSGSYPQFRAYGVDARGIAFLATEFVRGRSPLEQGSSPKNLERTFVEMLQVVAPIHSAGLVLGDISLDSFALDERGRITLWALLGAFESGARQTAILPPGETLQFLAPEQRSMAGVTPGADVFALGVYGYRLFTGRFLHSDKSAPGVGEDVTALSPAPLSVRGDLPSWVDDILGRCLESDPAARFRDVNDVLQKTFEAIQTGISPGGGGRWSRRTLIVTNQQKDQVIRPKALSRVSAVTQRPVEPKREEIAASVNKAVNVFTWVIAILVGMLGSGLLFFYFQKWDGGSTQDECSILAHAEYAPPELRPFIFDITAQGAGIERREDALGKISESRDPIAYAVLLAITKCNGEVQLKKLAEKLLVKRIGDQGFVRAATVLGKWFDKISAANKAAADLPVYTLFLRACDVARPLESRHEALKEAYGLDGETATQLAAALSLDEREDHFAPLLRAFLSEQSPGQSYDGKGAGALIVANARLSDFFANELSDLIPKFSDTDLTWILEQLSRSENQTALLVAKELMQRKAVPPFQAEFLRALTDNGRTHGLDALGRALIRGALGKVEREDISQFGRWMSLDAEPVLLAACATAATPELSVEAFDILAGKSISREPASSLLRWVKSQYWDYRKKMAKAIGILGLVDIASDQDIDFAMAELMPFVQGGSLFRVIVQTNEDRLIRSALERMGEITSPEDLLTLLGHRSKAVRMEAVKALKGRNELSVLQGILQAYSREKDDEVRQLYQQIHWVTRDRDPGTKVPQ